MAIRVLCPNDGKDEAGGLWAKDTEGRGLSCLAMPAALEAQGKGKKKKVPNGRRLTEDEVDVLCEMVQLVIFQGSEVPSRGHNNAQHASHKLLMEEWKGWSSLIRGIHGRCVQFFRWPATAARLFIVILAMHLIFIAGAPG